MSKPYKYEVNTESYAGKLAELFNWCDLHFARPDWVWNTSSFAFVNEADATLFALRWAT